MAGASQEESSDDGASASGDADGTPSDDAPEAAAQSASTAAADGSAGGTTVKIAVYRSSYQLSWDLNDEHGVESLMATWANGTREAPEWWEAIQGSPGSQVECPSQYTRDAEPKRTGYTFLGWSTDPAAPKGQMLDELVIPEDAEIAGEGDERTIALHAIWTPIEYSVVFDLTKNPEDASAVPSFSWTTGKGEFSDLGNGRYRLHGITLDDYDPETGLIEIATPSRGTGGYRFLSWEEPEGQQDPAVAMRRSGSAKWFVNPVALPHYDYEPVLTARWGLSFDVDVPSQVTFDEYDSLEVEGSLTDSTSKEDVDEESPDAHDRGKQAHFCSQSTATDYRIVGLESVRAASADDVLTTSDSTKATHEEVLGSERLLSMFASADRSESAGVHFRLDDAIDMDSARYSSFVIPRQQAGFDPSATDRDTESRLYVSYRLNLDNKVDGASEPNHGLVSAGNVADGVRTRIASVSYEFAVADHDVETTEGNRATGSLSDDFYIKDGSLVYGPADIEAAADDLARYGTGSRYYQQYQSYLACGMNGAKSAWSGTAVSGMLRWDDSGDGIPDTLYPVRIIGINHDDKSDGSGKAGLTFQFVSLLNQDMRMNGTTASIAGGWNNMYLRKQLQAGGSLYQRAPEALRDRMQVVRKLSAASNALNASIQATDDAFFILSLSEYTSIRASDAPWVEGTPYEFYARFSPSVSPANSDSRLVLGKQGSPTTPQFYWLRTISRRADGNSFACVLKDGVLYKDSGNNSSQVANGTVFGVLPAFCL